MKNGLGEIRQSKLVTTFGPGAILDLRGPSGAPISGLLAGLEEWDGCAPEGHTGLGHQQVIREPRLQRRLGVGGFRMPPVKSESSRRKEKAIEGTSDVLPVVRYPDWLLCPRCNRLGRTATWKDDPGKPDRWCTRHDGERVYVVPVRFIVACEDGHLDEFPWVKWSGCRCDGPPDLLLDTVGPGLPGKVVRCTRCGSGASLEGCFGKEALMRVGTTACAGHQPWLGTGFKEPCQRMPRVLQRGASNVYYGVLDSSLDIPPFSADLSNVFGRYWATLQDCDPADWPVMVKSLKLIEKTGKPLDVLLAHLQEWKEAVDADDVKRPLEWAEYVQFKESGLKKVSKGEYQTAPGTVPPELGASLSSVVLASRLREVRAITGFTRIHPPGGDFGTPAQRPGRLYRNRPDWLPAIELRGEGIFLRLEEETLASWASKPEVGQRVSRFRAPLGALYFSGELATASFAARFVLIHSLAHSLVRRLSLDCGYSSSALRERLYVGEAPQEMGGLLIHTGAADSEGTLGGLVRQGIEDRLMATFRGSLKEMAWCSSDPVCITGAATLSSPENGAACHACLLVPETSCQHFNRFLDRALLIGTPDNGRLGFFRTVLEEYVL